ncbi:MAG: IclR family transcriptional regulator, partial [Alicyclobacillus sp.]|nr:IclR family transcriptional regulator [Alicyclobacillus sp.]
IFNSLQANGVVRCDPVTKQYELDFGILTLSSRFLARNDLISAATPVLRALRDQTGESVCLNVRVGLSILTVLQFESKEPLRWSLQVGVPYPLNAGAGGKVLSAYSGLSDSEIAAGLQSLASGRPVELTAFQTELARVRQQGYAVSHGEINPGVTALAVPVYRQREVVASLGLYALTERLPDSAIPGLLEALRLAAEQISSMLAN